MKFSNMQTLVGSLYFKHYG